MLCEIAGKVRGILPGSRNGAGDRAHRRSVAEPYSAIKMTCCAGRKAPGIEVILCGHLCLAQESFRKIVCQISKTVILLEPDGEKIGAMCAERESHGNRGVGLERAWRRFFVFEDVCDANKNLLGCAVMSEEASCQRDRERSRSHFHGA